MATLQALQQPRPQATQARLNEAARLYINAVRTNRQEEYDPEALGFEFTIEQIEVRAIELEPDLFHEWAAGQQCRGAGCGPLEEKTSVPAAQEEPETV